MSENRRVVVTGMGAVTPLGNDWNTTWEGLKSGKNGIGPITRFDTQGYKATLAAEVRGFDPKDYLEVNEVLRTDRYAQLAVAAAQQLYHQLNGAERKQYVRDFLASKGYDVKDDEVDNAIEAAVLRLHHELEAAV